MSTVHLLIKGKVQGVFFRASTQEKAMEKGIRGWVKNTIEGDVEIKASGSEPEIQEFISWCYKGPENAKVMKVEITPCEENEYFDGFTIRR